MQRERIYRRVAGREKKGRRSHLAVGVALMVAGLLAYGPLYLLSLAYLFEYETGGGPGAIAAMGLTAWALSVAAIVGGTAALVKGLKG